MNIEKTIEYAPFAHELKNRFYVYFCAFDEERDGKLIKSSVYSFSAMPTRKQISKAKTRFINSI
jgi:hypothetical protein